MLFFQHSRCLWFPQSFQHAKFTLAEWTAVPVCPAWERWPELPLTNTHTHTTCLVSPTPTLIFSRVFPSCHGDHTVRRRHQDQQAHPPPAGGRSERQRRTWPLHSRLLEGQRGKPRTSPPVRGKGGLRPGPRRPTPHLPGVARRSGGVHVEHHTGPEHQAPVPAPAHHGAEGGGWLGSRTHRSPPHPEEESPGDDDEGK